MADDRSVPVTGDPKVFVLQRELSEVHLLMDNLSAKPDCGITRLNKEAHEAGLPADWVRAICDVDWPPEDAKEAEQAALLIRAKDFLNLQTSPATGMTIAFTLLVTQEDGEGGRRGFFSRFRNLDPLLETGAPSRNELARNAYPGLVGKAEGFRTWIVAISLFLLMWLMLTCAISWYVAYGNIVLGQLAEAQKVLVAAEERVATTQAGELKPVATTGDAVPTAPADTTQMQAALPVTDYCPPAGEGTSPQYGKLAQMQVCQARARAGIQVEAVEKTLLAWRNLPARIWVIKWFVGQQTPMPDVALHASSIANVLGTGVLPVFYGILGAGAAIVRLLSRKIRRSMLAPRDLNLAFQQLALGAVVGACIGLFVGGGEDGLLGPVALSGTALSFVAGFGVDQVFEAMEALLSRIFGTSQPGDGARTGA
jgi:hypothetical protein